MDFPITETVICSKKVLDCWEGKNDALIGGGGMVLYEMHSMTLFVGGYLSSGGIICLSVYFIRLSIC